ncbi:MAG: peptide ABC transporter substrate-binding protein, partial [Hyphomicrobiales bacterium]|nr:peptide ABC transporter substrate-binding protein [Hyphomicrobiales bacterium]
ALHPPTGCRFHTRCPHVMAICRTVGPRITEPSHGHEVACHLVG